MTLVNFLMMMGSVPRAAAPLPASLSGLTANLVSNGTGCGESLGTRYNVSWTPNASVSNGTHDVKVTLAGGAPTVTATQTNPATVTNVDVTSYEANNGLGDPLFYTLSWELIETAGPTVIQNGTFTPDFEINTDCIV